MASYDNYNYGIKQQQLACDILNKYFNSLDRNNELSKYHAFMTPEERDKFDKIDIDVKDSINNVKFSFDVKSSPKADTISYTYLNQTNQKCLVDLGNLNVQLIFMFDDEHILYMPDMNRFKLKLQALEDFESYNGRTTVAIINNGKTYYPKVKDKNANAWDYYQVKKQTATDGEQGYYAYPFKVTDVDSEMNPVFSRVEVPVYSKNTYRGTEYYFENGSKYVVLNKQEIKQMCDNSTTTNGIPRTIRESDLVKANSVNDIKK